MKKIKKIVKSFFIFKINEKYKIDNLTEASLKRLLKSKNIFKINSLYDSFDNESIFLLREKKEMLHMLLLKTPDSVYSKALHSLAGFIYDDLPEEIVVIAKELLEREDWCKLALIKDFVSENYKDDIKASFFRRILLRINSYFIFVEENDLDLNSYERRKIFDINLNIINENNLLPHALSLFPLTSNSDRYFEILKNVKIKNTTSVVSPLFFSPAKSHAMILNTKEHIYNNNTHKFSHHNIFIENLCNNLNKINEANISMSHCHILAFFDDIIPFLCKSLNNNSSEEEYRDIARKFANIINELNKNRSFTQSFKEFVTCFDLNKKLKDIYYSRIKVFIHLACLGFVDDKEFDAFISSQEIKKILKVNQKINTWEWMKDFKFFNIVEEKEINKFYKRSLILHKLINSDNNNNDVNPFLKEFFCLDKETGVFLIEKIIKEYQLTYYDLLKNMEISKDTNKFYLGYIKSRAEKEMMTTNQQAGQIKSVKKRL